MEEHQSIIQLDKATRMLAEIHTVDEAKNLINLAEAARVYAKQVKLGLEAQNHAAEIKLRAQRRAGEILDGMEKADGGIRWSRLQAETETPSTYADLGIDKVDAHRWQTIAAIPEDKFESFIAETKNADKELTTAAIYREARFEIGKQNKIEPPPMNGKYRVIYADPPWQYGDPMGIQGYKVSAEMHYPTMSIDELTGLPIKELAEDSAVLFLWVTSPLLESAFEIVKAWGFEYKSSFVWDKVRHNFGHYNSVRHELLLICTKGSCLPDTSQLIDSVQTIERTDHSTKPEIFREIINTLYPNGKRIELFARKNVNGWDTWGNELPNT